MVGQILLDVLSEMKVDGDSLKIYNHRPLNMSLYQPSVKHVLPLELKWKEKMKRNKWPSNKIPQIIGRKEEVLFHLLMNIFLFPYFSLVQNHYPVKIQVVSLLCKERKKILRNFWMIISPGITG